MGGKRQKTGVSGGRTTLSKLKGAARTSYIAARKVVKVKKSQGAPIVRRSMRGNGDGGVDPLLSLPVGRHREDTRLAVLRLEDIRASLLERFKAERDNILSHGQPILNDAADVGRAYAKDTSRAQHKWPEECGVKTILHAATQAIAERLDCVISASAPLSSQGATSDARCRRKRQAWHFDFSERKVEEWRWSHPSWPWTVLWALDDHARVMLRLSGGEDVVLLMRAGECVLFRGDVRHCGMPYTETHVRAHFYLEPKGCLTNMRCDRVEGGGEILALHSLEAAQSYKEASSCGPVARMDTPLFRDVSGVIEHVLG